MASHSQFPNEGQRKASLRKQRIQEERTASLQGEAAALGITIEQLQAKKFKECLAIRAAAEARQKAPPPPRAEYDYRRGYGSYASGRW